MLDRLDDTIVAVSSAPGNGAVGIVRLSGPKAIDIADTMVKVAGDMPLARRPGSTRISGEVRSTAEIGLPAVFYVFRAPHSYTRQDLVEIHSIGSPPVLEMIRRRAMALGAVAALLAHGAQATATDADRNTAIHLAVRGTEQTLVILCPTGPRSLLAGLVRDLVKAGTDLNARNADGKTALDLTASPELVEALRELSAKTGAELDDARPPPDSLVPKP
jgi:hypothetical protein